MLAVCDTNSIFGGDDLRHLIPTWRTHWIHIWLIFMRNTYSYIQNVISIISTELEASVMNVFVSKVENMFYGSFHVHCNERINDISWLNLYSSSECFITHGVHAQPTPLC